MVGEAVPTPKAVLIKTVVPSFVKFEDTVGTPPTYLTIPLAVVPDQFIDNDLSVESEPPPVKPVLAVIDT